MVRHLALVFLLIFVVASGVRASSTDVSAIVINKEELFQQNSPVLVRAIGPELAASGLQNSLQDTTLELHDGNGATFASIDDWKTNQQPQIIATTVPPKDDCESAIVATLSPGGYTAIVRGKNGTSGFALVEVYVLP